MWLKIVERLDEAEINVEASVMLMGFAANQLHVHGFRADALGVVHRLFETEFSDRNSIQYVMDEAQRRLDRELQSILGNQSAPPDQGEIQKRLLELLLGTAAQGGTEFNWGLSEKTVLAIAETLVTLAQRSETLAAQRQLWDAHSMADLPNLLAVRAEAAVADSDAEMAKRLLAQIDSFEQASDRTAPLWSLFCLFYNLEERFTVEYRSGMAGDELDKKIFAVQDKFKEHITVGSGGLRFKAPPDLRALAVGFKPVLRGAFEVTASYTIPDFTPPEKISGAGATLRVASKNEKRELAGFYATNGLDADRGGMFVMTRGITENGKRDTDSEVVSTGSRSGRLRFIRKGNRLHFLAAKEDSTEFQRLRSIDFTNEDVASVRLGVQALDPKVGMEVHWKDLVVRAEEIVGIPSDIQLAAPSAAEYASPTVVAESGPEPGSWLWAVVAGGILVLCVAGVLWWLGKRRARAARAMIAYKANRSK